MKQKWYTNDWFVITLSVLSLAAGAVANYFIHGGHIQW